MSENDFMKMVEAMFPGAYVDVDNYGQLVIYTGKRIVDGTIQEWNNATA